MYCHSTAKEITERGIQNRFERRFEEQLTNVRKALHKKHGTKKYEKVLEKIGRLKERYRVTPSMKRSDDKVVYVRKTARPEECHTRIYNALGLPSRPDKASKIIL